MRPTGTRWASWAAGARTGPRAARVPQRREARSVRHRHAYACPPGYVARTGNRVAFSVPMKPSSLATILPILSLVAAPLGAQSLDRQEQRLRATIAAAREEQISYLQRVVDIPSSTLNFEGVRKVGALFRASLDSLGFTTTWVAVPDAVGRAGHLVAEHRGKAGAVRMLLIGHLDTVVEPPPGGANWVREDSVARAVGGADMKGGDVVILY